MTEHQVLWRAVIRQALFDATAEQASTNTTVTPLEQRQSRDWIAGAGTDFRMACSLAGIDPDFLRDMFVAGRVCGRRLRAKAVGHKMMQVAV